STVSGPSASTASTRKPRRVARARTAALAREVTSSFTTDRPPRISLAWARHRAQTGGDEAGGLPGEDTLAADLDPPRAEVLARERPDDTVGRLGRVERRHARTDHVRRDELAGLEPPRTVERHPQDCAGREGAAEGEHVVAREVAERVGDQPALVPLHAAQHVRARADDEVGAGVDDGVREADRVAAVLAEEALGAGPDVLPVTALGTRVHGHDDHVGDAIGRADELLRGGDVGERRGPGIRR